MADNVLEAPPETAAAPVDAAAPEKPITETLKDRIARGVAMRKAAPRSSHDAVGDVKRDPIELLEASSAGRVEKLIPLRYGRMFASPFTFYRGSAIIQAHDLAKTPHSGITQQICGDAHLMNFGGFATPERNIAFDMNDFDETHPGPWEWDVKRLAASITIAARHFGYKRSVGDAMLLEGLETYKTRMAEHARMGALELWYDKLTLDWMAKNAKLAAARKAVTKAFDKAQQRTHANLLPKMGTKKDGKWVMNDAPPGLFHISGSASLLSENDGMLVDHVKDQTVYRQYLETISPSHRRLLSHFTPQDFAFKVVGVGSVGTRCLVLLLIDAQEQPLFLQVKEANQSVLARFVPSGKSEYDHEGQRVVVGQRLMQSSSDMFLGWATGPSGRHFYFRQLRDMKISFELETLDEVLLGRYAVLCFHVLARAHARSGGFAPEISGYLGKSARFAETLVKYANNYADQVERDFGVFQKACRSGRLHAQTDADFAADISI